MQHDLFDWFANIVIPAILGAATVVVTVLAWRTSRQATHLAKEVEAQRQRAEEAREAEDRRRLVWSMSIEEARALHRYAMQVCKPLPFSVHALRVADPDRSPTEQARDDAHVMLGQSLLPGALGLLEITEFDLRHRFDDVGEGTDAEGNAVELEKSLGEAVVSARDQRMFDRIRNWANDPDMMAAYIEHDLELSRTNLSYYLAKAGPR